MTENNSAQLSFGGNSIELPVVPAVEGNNGFNIAPLLKATGGVTYDPGFMNTAATKSAITFIDGDEGILRYRGYPIEQLAEKSSFLETSYLLIYGNLPSATELENFDQKIRRHTLLHEELKGFFGGFPRDAHPMPVLSSAVSALSTWYQDSLDPFNEEQVELSTIRLLAKMPVLAAYAHKKSIGQALLYPDNSMNLVENFMRLSFGLAAEPYDMDPVMVKALDQLLILHADHEQNCSTSTVRLVGSSNANMFASVSAGINALFGPAHGGANEAVLKMLRQIQSDGLKPADFMEKVKNKEDGVRLMAKLPTIAAYAYKKSVGQPFLYPDNTLSLVENYLRMTFGFPAEPYDLDPIMVKALDQLLILHADHEQNCSTATVRMVGSSHANLFASVSAGINALFGPLHGGANQAVMDMLAHIRDDGGDVDEFVRRVKGKESGIKLMGFGHRVYKNHDPRATLVKKVAQDVLDRLDVQDPLLQLAMRLEEVALADEYFVSRKLYPNVDFYTGFIYKALGFPTPMFTALFALGRLPGWIAQWREMIADPTTKIGRPRQVYTGPALRHLPE
ncbi:citrate/2-methylcitrate synthase [Paeniglutamicibacter sp.]|uniref:citrate/2-methylcitrate synthase n=1 Tax=Paeniglutamicibacter sp. TaxID=1934391 RepID=UPI003989377A